jgi:parallel beta-helix repeat protein
MKHERGKIGTALLFAVLIATLAFLSFGSVSAAQQHYVNSGESIQGAIDNANAGDTIIVRDGTYTENITVYKRLTIQSENGVDSTIVHAAGSHIFNITADHVSITGFTIEEASKKCGIRISGATNCNISNNIVSCNHQGIYLSKSNRNTIFNNNAFSNENNGIYLKDSNDNRITDNNASNNVNYHGISINSANNNEIRNNIANSN